MANMTINGQRVEAQEGKSILEAAIASQIYIPHLCYTPQMDVFSEITSIKEVYAGGALHQGEKDQTSDGCNLCLVQIRGREGLFHSCRTRVEDGMVITTDSPELKKARQNNLSRLLERHPHACLLCAQAEGCDLVSCSSNVPEIQRCCDNFGKCELRKVSQYIGTEMGLPAYMTLNIPVLHDEPLYVRDYNLCIGCLRCVRVCKDIKGADALGFTIEDGRVQVGSKAPTLKESGCLFCGFCVEVCPTGALKDQTVGIGERESYLIPCKSTCPAGADVPGYIRFMKKGEPEEAVKVIYERLPIPESLGRVCFHPCETDCRRASIDQPVSICALKRAASDHSGGFIPVPNGICKTDKKVAIIGTGPAGLSAAYYLNVLGHSVTLFEALPEAGGMLRVGIPEYRLPRDILNREIRRIEDAGIEIKVNQRIDSVNELSSEGYDAVFVAVGAHKGHTLGILGEGSESVIDGVTFLRNVNLGEKVDVGKNVAIIGGGNVAVDSARSALRMGAKSATILYRRTREEMPAYEEEVEAALEEGINIQYLTAPVKVEQFDSTLEIHLIRMDLGEPDGSGRRRPVPIEGSEYTLQCNTLITAIGQRSEVPRGIGIVEENPCKGVFLGGDLLTGPATVVDAVASGRKGAEHIDRFLGGAGDIGHFFSKQASDQLQPDPDAVSMDNVRTVIPMLASRERISDFSEVCLGLDPDAAIAEAKRCLECDLRFLVIPPVLPPEQWLTFDEKTINSVPELEGVYILYNEQKEIHSIAGVMDLRKKLCEEFEKRNDVKYFTYEEDPMYTVRESQLVQQYMQKHGKMPLGGDDLDDLF
ncbi:MAG: FAD-dependent oxidoreductase [Thermodesulfobacteriota bacterium]|nr:FAD-dependent oxidoreductase [Thermodesulfobacteriota bacterium]